LGRRQGKSVEGSGANETREGESLQSLQGGKGQNAAVTGEKAG